jgi:oxygen-independent coproporphyrinogen-3 oxidase
MSRAGNNSLGLYVSIPFCRSKCTYCNFASGVYPASEHARYVERVIQDLRTGDQWAAAMGVVLPRQVDTVYLGGGTPSVLSPDLLSRLFNAMRSVFNLDPDAEITMECAPGQLPDAALEAIAAAGVNRVSLGVQSFIDREAQVSGRLHNRRIVEDDLRRLRSAGIHNINLDLITGLAGQTHVSWQESLNALVDAGTPHASIYTLEVDEDSRLGREMLAGGARYYADLVPADDAIAEMYLQAIETLHAAGLNQYEISNFSRPGFESAHNLRYWRRRPYLGVGLDASSALYAEESSKDDRANAASHLLLRSKTTDNLAEYLAVPKTVQTDWLSPVQQHEEAWFLGLRLNAAVKLDVIEREFGREMLEQAMEAVGRLVDLGLLTSDGESVRLTSRGRLLSNEVFQQFLRLDPNEAGCSQAIVG